MCFWCSYLKFDFWITHAAQGLPFTCHWSMLSIWQDYLFCWKFGSSPLSKKIWNGCTRHVDLIPNHLSWPGWWCHHHMWTCETRVFVSGVVSLCNWCNIPYYLSITEVENITHLPYSCVSVYWIMIFRLFLIINNLCLWLFCLHVCHVSHAFPMPWRPQQGFKSFIITSTWCRSSWQSWAPMRMLEIKSEFRDSFSLWMLAIMPHNVIEHLPFVILLFKHL